MLIRFLLVLIFLATALSCRSGGPQQKVTRLPSGKEIKITSIVKMNFPASGPALVMNYITDISMDDMPALLKEVDEVWSVFQADVENAHVDAAVIRATHMEGSFIKSGKGYGFVFVKREDGQWHRMEEGRK
jgi:hypothetical protein